MLNHQVGKTEKWNYGGCVAGRRRGRKNKSTEVTKLKKIIVYAVYHFGFRFAGIISAPLKKKDNKDNKI